MLDIDTVSINTPAVPAPDVLRDPARYHEVKQNDEVVRHTGRLRNLRVLVTPHGTRVTGSVARYINGTTLSPFDPAAVGPALDEIEGTLGLPEGELHYGRVSRVDVGANLALDRPVAEYLASMEAPQRHQRAAFGDESLYFQNTLRQLVFYDKVEEARGRGVPEHLADANVLRYELRLTSKVQQQVGQPVVAGLLADADFYRRLADLWLQHFERVGFKRVLRIDRPATVPELRDGLALRGIDAVGGRDDVLRAIRTSRHEGLLDYDQSYRQRKWVAELAQDPCFTADADVAVELRAAVAAVHAATRTTAPN